MVKLTSNVILLYALLVIGIALMSYFIYTLQKKRTEAEKLKEDLMKYNMGISLVVLIIAILAFVLINTTINLMTYQKSIATSLLLEKDPKEFLKKCDKLFVSSGDENILKDFRRMKAEKPRPEVNTMCANYAKRVLGRKGLQGLA